MRWNEPIQDLIVYSEAKKTSWKGNVKNKYRQNRPMPEKNSPNRKINKLLKAIFFVLVEKLDIFQQSKPKIYQN